MSAVAKLKRRELFRAGAAVGALAVLPAGLFGCATDATSVALGTVVDGGLAPRAFDTRGLSWLLAPREGRVEVRDADGTLVQSIDGLAYPAAIAIDASDRAWVVEIGTSTLACIDLERATTTRYGAGILRGARDVAIDVDGQVLVADLFAHQVVRFDDRGGFMASLGTPITGASADESVLNGPRGVALAHDGTVLVAEVGARRVTRLAPDGTWLETVASDFIAPRELRVAPSDGRFAVADTVRGDVTVYDARGALLATHRSARLPEAIAFARDGALWISGREHG